MNIKILASEKRDLIFKHDVFNITVRSSVEETTIFFYGELGFVETDYKKIKTTVTDALNKNQNITIRINSHNGSIIEGIAVYDLIKSFPNNVTVIIEGVVSDFTIPIALSGDKILMSENAFLNIEGIQTVVSGNEDEVAAQIDKLKIAGSLLFEIFKKRVPQFHQEEFKKYFKKTNGVWLDSTMSKKFNLCDEIILSVKKRRVQEDEIASAMILHPKNNISIDISASKFLEDRNDWSFNQWQEKDSKGLEKLAMRFPSTFSKLFEAYYPNQTLENNLNSYKPLKNIQMNNQNKESWTFSDWQKEDPKGLQELEKGNPTAFNRLFEAEYPKEAIASNSAFHKSINTNLNNQNRENWTFKDWQKEDPKGLGDMEKNDFEKFKNLFDKQFNSTTIL